MSPTPRRRDPLARALQLLAAMIDLGEPSYGVRQLANELELPPSSTHRILNLLEPLGMVARTTTGAYELGHEFYRLAARATARRPVRSAAAPVLRQLVDRCGETAFFNLYDPHRREMIFAMSVEASHPLRYVVELNRWVPVYLGASGLAILAFLPDEERKEVFRTMEAAGTVGTADTAEDLERQCAQVRRRGYAISRGKRIPGAVGIAAPVWEPEGAIVGDISVTVPEHRFRASDEKRLAVLVVEAANELTARLGGREAPDAGAAAGA